MEAKHDRALLQILQEEKDITHFLNAFFGFLYRCTDFYIEAAQDNKLGFPPGASKKLVSTILQKWNDVHHALKPQFLGARAEPKVKTNRDQEFKHHEPPLQPCDSYNGAIREKYTWSQSISDLDVVVKIPECVRRAKDLKVEITANKIAIAGKTDILKANDCPQGDAEESADPEWTAIFVGELSFKTQRGDSIWSMVPGKHINIHLEKATERWWEALINGEPNIELSEIDCSRHMDDLGAPERMKVQELMWNHRQKLLGKPTSEEINMQRILKKAWNAERSPFQGTDYDPSVLNSN